MTYCRQCSSAWSRGLTIFPVITYLSRWEFTANHSCDCAWPGELSPCLFCDCTCSGKFVLPSPPPLPTIVLGQSSSFPSFLCLKLSRWEFIPNLSCDWSYPSESSFPTFPATRALQTRVHSPHVLWLQLSNWEFIPHLSCNYAPSGESSLPFLWL